MKSTHLRPIQGGRFPAGSIAGSTPSSVVPKITLKAQTSKNILKQSQDLVNRRYSFDDNGGGYTGL
jgi:hypothetical protein